MYKLKTKLNAKSVKAFLDTVQEESKRADCYKILDLMQSISGQEPKMWGKSIVGFGTYHYRYASGNKGEWMKVGFSPRKSALTLYIMSGFKGYDELLKNLGHHKTGKSCLYIKQLDDIDLKILAQIIKKSIDIISKRYV